MSQVERPVFIEKKLDRWKRPDNQRPGTALVFVGDGVPLRVVYEGQKGLTQGELIWGKYNLYYEVDMGDRSLVFSEKIPCASRLEFNAEVKLFYAVKDPLVIIRQARLDIDEFLKDSALVIMRQVSRQYSHEDNVKAEADIIKLIEEEINDNGFKLSRRVFVKLSLDDKIQTRLVNKELETIDFEEKQAKITRDFALKNQKAEILAPLIRKGDWPQLLAMLDPNNPEDAAIQNMVNAIIDGERSKDSTRLKMLEIAINKGAMENWELSDFAKELFQEITGIPDQSIAFLEGKSGLQGEPPSPEKSDIMDVDDISRESEE
jgi:hypothetical protein